MKKAKLPLPVLILISATLLLFSSFFGEWIARASSASPIPRSETVEAQKAAIVYVRVMSWLSRMITHPAARPEDNVKCAPSVEPISTEVYPVAAHSGQLCALDKSSHTCKRERRFSRSVSSRAQPSQSSREVPSAAGVLRDSSATADGS